MKKILISLLVIIGIATVQSEAFAWDWMSALKFWDRATEAQAAEAQKAKTLTDIQNQMTTIDKTVQDAFIDIVSELSTRKEAKNIKSELKTNSANFTNIISNYTTKIASNKDNFVKEVNNLSTKEKTALANNIATLAESTQQYLLLATDGVKTATNTLKATQKLSEFATTVTNINNTANQLKNRAATVINFVNQAKAIAQTAGVAVQ